MTVQRHAITFPIKPEADEEVARLLSSYGRPVTVVDEQTRLLSTAIFLKDHRVVRVLDIEGSLPAVMQHIGRQPQVQEVENAINPHLTEERDMTTPDGVRTFFMRAFMAAVSSPVVPQRAREGLLPYAFMLSFRAGTGSGAMVAVEARAGVSWFQKGDQVVCFLEDAESASDAVGRATTMFLESGLDKRLRKLLLEAPPTGGGDRWLGYLEGRRMRLVTYRVA